MATATPTATPSVSELEDLFEQAAYEFPWRLLVLDCDCHSMEYVVAVFMKHFELAEEVAVKKMFEVHKEGQSVLASGTREEMEFHHLAMGTYGLESTIEQED